MPTGIFISVVLPNITAGYSGWVSTVPFMNNVSKILCINVKIFSLTF
jgi:hypothetical protein